jgi:uncharacterized protein (DUF2249 family)
MKTWKDMSRQEKKVLLKWKMIQLIKEGRKFPDKEIMADHACMELIGYFYLEKGDNVIRLKIKGKKVKIKCL